MRDFDKKQEAKWVKSLSYKAMASLIDNLDDDQLDDLIFDTFLNSLDKDERKKILITLRKFAVSFERRGRKNIQQLLDN